MRAFVTGGHGFVGGWLADHLREAGDEVVVAGTDVDVTDPSIIGPAMAEARPDAVYHLAALTHVGRSWDEPARTFEVNALGTLHVLEAARRCGSDPRVLLVGSAEVYGVVKPGDLPLVEDRTLRPATPYAVSKVAAEQLGLQAHLGYGQHVVAVRAFNHVGPGQAPTFVVPDFARQVIAAEREGRRELTVGNLSARRDFTDVRDVVRAYRLLVERGEPGQAYNVCSGVDVRIEDLARRLLELAGVDCELVVDPSLSRPVDVPVLRGDPSRIRAATGWQPEIPLDRTLSDVLDHFRTEASAPAG